MDGVYCVCQEQLQLRVQTSTGVGWLSQLPPLLTSVMVPCYLVCDPCIVSKAVIAERRETTIGRLYFCMFEHREVGNIIYLSRNICQLHFTM